MIYRIYPSKDATLYEDSSRKNQNTGKDEILEVGKFYDIDNTTLLGNSRVLVEFDLTEISSSIVNGEITSPEYRLRVENIESRGIASSYELYAFPVRESWDNGVGSEADTPHNTLDSTWVNRVSDSIWNTQNATVDKAKTPGSIAALETYYDFVDTSGSFELIEQIKGTDGTPPRIRIIDSKLELSASNYGGATLNLSASNLKLNSIYNVDFDLQLGGLNGVDFRIYDPHLNPLNSAQLTNYAETLSTNGTYTFAFTASIGGLYKIQLSYFDSNGYVNGVTGTIDNFIVYRKVDRNTLILDEFQINGPVANTYFLNNGITGAVNNTASIFVENEQLVMRASNFAGATMNRGYILQAGVPYTSSFEYNTLNMPDGIDFVMLDPDGRSLRDNEIVNRPTNLTGAGTSSFFITPQQDGEYLFTWEFFGSGSSDYSASFNNFTLKVDFNLINTSSRYTDIFYDARWVVNEGGGTWYTSSFINGVHYKQTFNNYTDNLNVEVTEYVNEWLDGTRDNYGFIIKKSNTDESSTTKFGSIKFFSSDTHTIYPPTLEVRWDDSLFLTGSLNPLTSEDIILYVKGLNTEYKETSKAKIRVFGRDRFPQRSFTSTPIKDVKYLPTTVYYSVVDAETEQVFIPFDTNYTKLSCDSTSNYFNFWFNGLQPERYYKFIFRVDQNGTTKFIDDNFYFKVIR
jgi:hypothetical protein